MTTDWTKFVRRILIKAPVEKIYRCWTTQNELETWFLRKAEFSNATNNRRDRNEHAQKGDSFHWEWHNWDGQELGHVTKANDLDALSFTFADGLVHVTMEAHEDETLVSLIQEQISTDVESQMKIFVGCSNGWTFWMTNLKAYLEYGTLLHNTTAGSTIKYDGFEMINI